MTHQTLKEILLNVYDINSTNSIFHGLGLGFYHSGVEIAACDDDKSGGYEYSFSSVGISRSSPRLNVFGSLRSTIRLGVVRGDTINIHKLISILGRTSFAPGTYDLINNNCNHFTDAVAYALLEVNIPSWINRFAYLGSILVPPTSVVPPVQSSDLLSSRASSVNSAEKKIPVVIRNQNDVVDSSESPESTWLCGVGIDISLPFVWRDKPK